jgi:hypothetical protein
VGEARTLAQTASFAVGSARLDFSGTWAPLTQQGKIVGLFLDGSGTFSYTSHFDPEWPVMARNLKEWTKLGSSKDGAGLNTGVGFSKARFLFAGLPAFEWGGTPAILPGGTYAAFMGAWGKVDGYAPSHLLAAQTNTPSQAVAVLEMDTPDKQHYVYVYDPVVQKEETFSQAHPFEGAPAPLNEWFFRIPLSRQYLGWDPRKGATPAPFMITNLDVDLRTEDNRQAAVVVQETISPTSDGLSVLNYGLISEIETGKETRHLKVSKITDEKGQELAFSHTHDLLSVQLPEPARRNQPLRLRFEYAGDFLVRPREDSYWQLEVAGNWYPQARGYSGEFYQFHGTVRTKGDWHAFLPGETVRREKEGEWNLVETRTEKPICWTTILGGKYSLTEETKNGLTVRIATYGFKPGASAQVFKDQAFNVVAYYQTFLGPFPFKEFTIIEKNEWGYGQAPPGMMYITKDAFEQIQHIMEMQDLAGIVTRYGGRFSFRTMDVRHVFAHEIAHQYWGTVVKMPTASEQWLTESFADYCAALYERDFKGKGYFDKNLAQWKALTDKALDKGPIPLANDLRLKDGFEGFQARFGLLYAKGPLLLATLHQELGDQLLLTWLKSAQTNFRWKFATTAQMFDLLKFITKKDYAPFVQEYFWGIGMPPAKTKS